MKSNWYCYLCGKEVKSEYYLISMNNSTDRVFLVCGIDCLNKISQEEYIITKVREV